MKKNPNDRLSLEGVMRHPWILKYAKTDMNITSNASFSFNSCSQTDMRSSCEPSYSQQPQQQQQQSATNSSYTVNQQQQHQTTTTTSSTINSATYLIASASVNSASNGIIPQTGAQSKPTSGAFKYSTSKPGSQLTGKESFSKK